MSRNKATGSNKYSLVTGPGSSPGRSDQSIATLRKDDQSGVINVRVTPHLAAPERMFYADYVNVQFGRDGADIIFGKLRPTILNDEGTDATLGAALEVSFPFGQFYNQLYKSLVQPQEQADKTTASFRDVVKKSVETLKYEKITEMPKPVGPRKFAAIRANAAFISIFEDDSALDFFHLDAISMQALISGSARGEIRGIVRVAMSPSVLLYFVEECVRAAQSLPDRIPDIETLSKPTDDQARSSHG